MSDKNSFSIFVLVNARYVKISAAHVGLPWLVISGLALAKRKSLHLDPTTKIVPTFYINTKTAGYLKNFSDLCDL